VICLLESIIVTFTVCLIQRKVRPREMTTLNIEFVMNACQNAALLLPIPNPKTGQPKSFGPPRMFIGSLEMIQEKPAAT